MASVHGVVLSVEAMVAEEAAGDAGALGDDDAAIMAYSWNREECKMTIEGSRPGRRACSPSAYLVMAL